MHHRANTTRSPSTTSTNHHPHVMIMETTTRSWPESEDDWLDSLESQIPNDYNSFVVRAPKITLLTTKTVSTNASTSTPAALQAQISPDVFSRRSRHHTHGASDPFMRMVGNMAHDRPLPTSVGVCILELVPEG